MLPCGRLSAAGYCGGPRRRLPPGSSETGLSGSAAGPTLAGQAAAGQRALLWELVRQLAGRKDARGPRPIAVQHTADGRIISRREELLECGEDLFAAEFSGHARTPAY